MGAAVGGAASALGAAVGGISVAEGASTGTAVASGGKGVGDGCVWLVAGAWVATAASVVGVLVGVGVEGGADWQPASTRVAANKKSNSPVLIKLGVCQGALRRLSGCGFDMGADGIVRRRT